MKRSVHWTLAAATTSHSYIIYILIWGIFQIRPYVSARIYYLMSNWRLAVRWVFWSVEVTKGVNTVWTELIVLSLESRVVLQSVSGVSFKARQQRACPMTWFLWLSGFPSLASSHWHWLRNRLRNGYFLISFSSSFCTFCRDLLTVWKETAEKGKVKYLLNQSSLVFNTANTSGPNLTGLS